MPVRRKSNGLRVWGNRTRPCRVLKKTRLLTRPTPARLDAPFPKQGRSEYRTEEVHTALRVGRSPLQWVLANGKSPPVFPISEKLLLNVEGLDDARTPLADFFSILLSELCARPREYPNGWFDPS